MNHIHDRRIHLGSSQISVSANVDVLEGLSEPLSLLHVDCNELQYPVLGDHADDHSSPGFIVVVDNGDAPGS